MARAVSEPPSAGAVPRVLRIAGREVPLVLPSVRDPRLHVAAVIVSLHVLGQVALGFDVSVAQILVAVVTCAVIEVTWTVSRTGRIVWPASALLTGSGVALIFRVLGTENGDYWSFEGWHLYALVAGGSLLTKYVIRHRGSHVFNPSNLGLVAAFVVLGSGRVEPLDLWWGPFGWAMAAAYGVILVGGLAVTARLGLLGMAAGFWVTLAAGIGALAASGHCITARWSFAPVCDGHFWWVVVSSPEVLVFLFFMITDPRTVPAGRVARVLFGMAVAVASTLLIAPQRTEFGAKVGLLAGLVVLTAVRPVFDRFLPAAGEAGDRMGAFAARLLGGPDRETAPRRVIPRGAGIAAFTLVFVVGVMLAGQPARRPLRDAPPIGMGPEERPVVDPAMLPRVTVDPDVAVLDETLADPDEASALARALVAALRLESGALRQGDRALLASAAADERLDEMEARLDRSAATGTTTVTTYDFDSLRLVVTFPFGPQGGAVPGFEARGTQTDVGYDRDGRETDRISSPCAVLFSLEQAADGNWLIVAAQPIS